MLKHHLEQKDRTKERKRKYESEPETKRKRARHQYEKMQNELQKQVVDAKKGKTYGSRIALETEEKLSAFVLEDDRKKKKLKSQVCPFVGCFGRNHKTTLSKECAYHGCCTRSELRMEIKKYLKKTFPEEYGEYGERYYCSKKRDFENSHIKQNDLYFFRIRMFVRR